MTRGITGKIVKAYRSTVNSDTAMYIRLMSLFFRNDWKRKAEIHFLPNLLKDLFEMLLLLDTDQRSLILSLLEEFRFCTYDEYPTLTSRLVMSFNINELLSHDDIVVVPIHNIDAKHNGMSGTGFAYAFYNYLRGYVSQFFTSRSVYTPHITLYTCNTAINDKHFGRALFIYVDDFIGSGEQSLTCVNDIIMNRFCGGERIIVASLIAQYEGVARIRDHGIPCYVNEIRYRGISDSKLIADVPNAIGTMQSICRLLNATHPLGRFETEALVTMQRIPNNTFGVFWDSNQGKRKGPIPFPRF